MTGFKSPDAGPFDYVLLLLLATIWSLSFGAIKVAVETIPPITLAFSRMALAAVILTLMMRLWGGRFPAWGREWIGLFAVALVGNGLPFFLIGWGEVKIDSSLAAILMAVMPLTTALIAHVFTQTEKLNGIKLVGIALGFSGVAVLVGPDALAGLGDDVIRQMAVAGGAVCYGIASVITRSLPPAKPVDRSAVVLVLASLQMVPVMIWLDQPWTLSPSTESIWAVVFLGLFPTGLAAILYFKLIAVRGATFITYNNYLIPMLGVLWGFLFLGEIIEPRALAALGLVLAGIAVAMLGARKRA